MSRQFLMYLGPVLAFCLVLIACEEVVDPTLENERPFTLWGVINAETDTHMVRVFEIAESLQRISPGSIDAQVTSTDLNSGAVHVWRDSMLTLPTGDARHVFWTVFPAAVGHTYRLKAERSDGANSYADVTIPAEVALEPQAPVATITEASQIVKIIGEPPSVPRIGFAYDLAIFRGDGTHYGRMWLELSYRDYLLRGRDQWEVKINYMRDFRDLLFLATRMGIPAAFLQCYEVELRVHVGDENWVSPIGVFDPEALVEPGVLSNVENGFGFVGAGYIERERWIPDRGVLQSAGFGVQVGQ